MYKYEYRDKDWSWEGEVEIYNKVQNYKQWIYLMATQYYYYKKL